MKKKTIHHVKKRTLLAIAGCVWLIAGFNVARLGVLAYIELGGVKLTQARCCRFWCLRPLGRCFSR